MFRNRLRIILQDIQNNSEMTADNFADYPKYFADGVKYFADGGGKFCGSGKFEIVGNLFAVACIKGCIEHAFFDRCASVFVVENRANTLSINILQ